MRKTRSYMPYTTHTHTDSTHILSLPQPISIEYYRTHKHVACTAYAHMQHNTTQCESDIANTHTHTTALCFSVDGIFFFFLFSFTESFRCIGVTFMFALGLFSFTAYMDVRACVSVCVSLCSTILLQTTSYCTNEYYFFSFTKKKDDNCVYE